MNKFFIANAEFAKFSRNYMEHKKSLPIRPSELGVLNIITETEGPHTSVQLAELLGVSKPMITAHISVLMEKGYIIKQQSQDDKRSFFIHPTEKAIELVERAKEEMTWQMEQIVAQLGAQEFEHLVNLVKEANLILTSNQEANKEV